MYATYEEYLDVYLLGRAPRIPAAEFDFWITQASAHLDRATFDRLKDDDTLARFRKPVIRAVCAIAEALLISAEATAGINGATSISQGGFSVSFDVASGGSQDARQSASIARLYLADTGLLSRAVG